MRISTIFKSTMLLLVVILFTTCGDKKLEPLSIDPEFASHVISFTSGIVSNSSKIQVRMVEEVVDAKVGEYLSSNPFSFSPSLKGRAKWIDKQTIEFVPNVALTAGEIYNVSFDLHKFQQVPTHLKTLKFRFQVKHQGIKYEFNGMSVVDEEKNMNMQNIHGILYSADKVSASAFEKIVSAKIGSEKQTISWKHSADGLIHYFTIEKVERKNTPQVIKIKWKGKEIGAKSNGETSFEMPALHDFKVIHVRTQTNPKTLIEVFFSDPLSKIQDIDGLFVLQPSVGVSLQKKGNNVLITPHNAITGKVKLIVSPNVKNIYENILKSTYTRTLRFVSNNPQVQFIGDGVIVPNTDGIILPFKAISLSGVDVKIIKIFENNIVQFLQTNELNGDREIKRVGRIVYNSEIDLTSDSPIDYHKWNTFALDLANLITPEPGAIYRVEISFRKKHSLYPMIEDANSDNIIAPFSQIIDPNKNYNDVGSYWDYYEDDYYYDTEDYNWEESDDPSKSSYYMYNRHKIVKNVLSSDFGIIAKAGSNNDYFVVVTDLRTTDPIKGVEIEFRNLQNQTMGVTRTNSDGMCKLNLQDKPFVLIAKKGKQRGYLRLSDASSLSLSMFDVSGEEIKKGVKGFLYGERDVWRPGDIMYLTFILEDKLKSLPANHPVVLELTNPLGQLTQRIVKTNHVNGFYNFTIRTEPSAPTGNWTAKVSVGNSTFSRAIRIETVKPNRLKINLTFPSDLLKMGQNHQGSLEVNWLYGSPASNARVEIDAIARAAQTSFKECVGYVFDDPTKSFVSEDIALYKGAVNAQGKASIPCKFNFSNEAPGMVSIEMKTRAFEVGGDFSIDRSLFKYSPYKKYVGVKMPEGKGWNNALYSDEKNLIPIALVDENGKAANGKVKIEIFNIYWRWWWDQSEEDNLADYVSNENRNLIKTDYIDIRNGRGVYEMNLNEEYWGRKLIKITDMSGNHSTGAIFYTTYKGWWSNASSENPGGAEILMFKTNKKQYKVGEIVSIELPFSHKGRALISIESGSRVLHNFWFTPTEKKSEFQFEVTPEMSPNVFIHISYIQAHNKGKNDYPIRMYGVQAIEVEDPTTHITPVITMKEELKPLEKFTISIKEKTGKPMTFTVSVVDEGLLDLTRYKTPNPWKIFYNNEALGVRTWDLYQYVAGAFTGKISGLFAVGGDFYLNKVGKENTNRFKPVVLHQSPISIGKGETKTLTFQMPNYIGSVRVMVVAGNNGAYGASEKTVAVKQPLMVLATVPRVISPTETMIIPVSVISTDKTIKNTTVSIAVDANFEVIDGVKRTVVFEKEGEKIVEFKVRSKKTIASGTIQISASSGNNKATSETNLQIRMPNPPVSQSTMYVIKPGESWSQKIKPIGIHNTNFGSIELSRFYPINLEKRINYLIQYPHGCLEQITSTAFPQLFLSNLMELSEAQKIKIDENIKVCLRKIKTYQCKNGGLSYWPGHADDANEWATNYAGHFMLEAKSLGYEIPDGLLDSWVSYQTQMANNWQFSANDYTSDMNQAYRLYTLALAKKPALSAMNRMRETSGIDAMSKWRLAAGYVLAGKPEIGQQLINGLHVKSNEKKYYQPTFGSEERDQAMVLETLVLLKNQSYSFSVAKDISSFLSSNEWYSTQSLSYMLLAISKFAGYTNENTKLNCTLSINGVSTNIQTKSPIHQTQLSYNKQNSDIQAAVVNRSESPLYIFVNQFGIPPMTQNEANSQNLTMTVKYYDLQQKEISPNVIKQGTDFYAEVTITHPNVRKSYSEMALEHLFPSGWEIMSSRLDANQSEKFKSDEMTYQDIRDDRVYSYFNLSKGEKKTIRVLLHATYIGTYYLPSVRCEAMYDNSIQANSEGKWIEVIK